MFRKYDTSMPFAIFIGRCEFTLSFIAGCGRTKQLECLEIYRDESLLRRIRILNHSAIRHLRSARGRQRARPGSPLLNAPVNEPNNRGRNEITSAILEASPASKCLHAGTPHYARCSVNNATRTINSFAVAWNEETALEGKEEGGRRKEREGESGVSFRYAIFNLRCAIFIFCALFWQLQENLYLSLLL